MPKLLTSSRYASRPVSIVSMAATGITLFSYCCIRTFQGLLTSNPAGALAASICPRMLPVSLLSRFITTQRKNSSALFDMPSVMRRVCSSSRSGRVNRTLLVPLVYRSPRTLAAVLPVLEFRHASAGRAKHLPEILLEMSWTMSSRNQPQSAGGGTYSHDDSVGNQRFEWDTHDERCRAEAAVSSLCRLVDRRLELRRRC